MTITVNTLRLDPTRTESLRRQMTAVLDAAFDALRERIIHLVVEEDAFGLTPRPIFERVFGGTIFGANAVESLLLTLNCGGPGSGVPGPCPSPGGLHRRALQAALRWKAKVGGSATAAVDKIPGGKRVREKLGGLRGKMEERYGKHTALAIVGIANAISWGAFIAGPFLGHPNYIPASGLMLAGAALAEGYLQGSRGVRAIKRMMTRNVRPDPAEPFTLSMDEIVRGAKSLVYAILEEANSVVRDAGLVPVGRDTASAAPAAKGQGSLVTNAGRWQFLPDPDKVRVFREWLKAEVGHKVTSHAEDALWQKYIDQSYRQGAGRAFDDVNRKAKLRGELENRPDVYAGARGQFLQTSPVSVQKVKLLAGRAFDELEDVTSQMSTRMSRILVDGLIRGTSPRELGEELAAEVGVTRSRGQTIARTEIVRAHAEGQLDALEEMGVEEVGVMVEWTTTPDHKTCLLCAPLSHIVLKLTEARGMIPRHPNCRCAWIPANLGGDDEEQIRTARAIRRRLQKSEQAEDDPESDWRPVISGTRPAPMF